jgi:predicted amidohydrolase
MIINRTTRSHRWSLNPLGAQARISRVTDRTAAILVLLGQAHGHSTVAVPAMLPSSNQPTAPEATKETMLRRIAVAQLRSTGSKFQNLLDVATCAGYAKREGAKMLFLPENFGFIGQSSDDTRRCCEAPILSPTNFGETQSQTLINDPQLTESLKSAIAAARSSTKQYGRPSGDVPDIEGMRVSLLEGLQTIARETQMWISGGGMHVGGAPSRPGESLPRVYNTQVIVRDTGDFECIYRKIHLFDVSIPGKVNLCESASTAPGDKVVVCDSPVGKLAEIAMAGGLEISNRCIAISPAVCLLGKLGLSICYDVRFPELYVELVKRGAEVILVPSAFTVPTGHAHWHALLRGMFSFGHSSCHSS